MRTLKVEFTESEINNLVNQVVELAENEEKCHEKNGYQFNFGFNKELVFFVTVLISDSYDSRYVSSDIKLITNEGFYPVESNINYKVEDKINKGLISKFEKQ